MKVILSLNAIRLVKFVLSHTGKKEENNRGEEFFSSRPLAGDEHAQRRHFKKAVADQEKGLEDDIEKLVAEHNKLIDEKRNELKKQIEQKKDEPASLYEKRLLSLLELDQEFVATAKKMVEKRVKLQEKTIEFEITDKTFEVVKKYFKEYHESVGWEDGADKIVEELLPIFGEEETKKKKK